MAQLMHFAWAMQVQLPVGTLPLAPAPRQERPSSAFAELLTESDPSAAPARPARQEVTAVRTPLSAEQAKHALRQAWTSLFGEPPSEATTGILTAQWAHETASGDSMFNYNFAGIKGKGPSGLTVNQATREGSGATQVRIRDNFRAYHSAEEGATDYLKLLQRRYEPALDAARQGDPAAFVSNLKAGGYFTGDERLYTRSIVRLAEQAVGPNVLSIGAGGALPSAAELTRPARAAAPEMANAMASVGFLDSLQVGAVLDEMSRSALRMAADTSARRNRGNG
jgi:hypothetical protein